MGYNRNYQRKRVGVKSTSNPLKLYNFHCSEGISNSNLHHAGRTLDACEIGPVARGVLRGASTTCKVLSNTCGTTAPKRSPTRIRCDSIAGPTGVDGAQSLSIRYIENVPTDRQLVVLTPGHRKLFSET